MESSTETLPYTSRITLLTAGERRFFCDGLRPAIGQRYLVSFKVRLADVITVDCWRSSFGRKIAQKHLDFVLLSPTATRIIAAIELNDATHKAPKRRRRDEFVQTALGSAQVPFVSFSVYRTYKPAVIRRRILGAIATYEGEHEE